MRAAIFSLLAAATLATSQSTDAPVITNNPIGASYIAKLPSKEGSALQGTLVATSSPDGKGINLAVSFSGLPKEGGPFMYHIHAKPVPADGNCTATGAHLDPYNRGETPLCDSTQQNTCQTGDLSGKHGNITEESVSISYHDSFLALTPSDPSFLGNLSFVLHLSNKTRIGCANFVEQASGVTTALSSTGTAVPSSGIPTGHNSTLVSSTATETRGPTGTPIPPTTTGTTVPTGAAQKLVAGAGAGALVAGFAALMI